MDQAVNKILLIMGVIFAIGVIMNILAYKLRGGRKTTYPYVKEKVLFSAAERSFLGVLDQAIGEEYRLFGKVRLADLIKVKKGVNRKSYFQAFNRISAKHIDYVVCRADDLSIELLIELDDKSHAKATRIKRDKFVDAALAAAELPLLRVPAKRSYCVEDIASQIEVALMQHTDEVVSVSEAS